MGREFIAIVTIFLEWLYESCDRQPLKEIYRRKYVTVNRYHRICAHPIYAQIWNEQQRFHIVLLMTISYETWAK